MTSPSERLANAPRPTQRRRKDFDASKRLRVLELKEQGMTGRDIAEIMGVSESRVWQLIRDIREGALD